MQTVVMNLLHKGYSIYQRVANPRFYALRRDAKGLLSPKVYRAMYECVFKLPDLDIVEIGGAAGAGSIAIAWAMKESGKDSKLITVEKCEGGSRGKFGGYNENLNIITNNFDRFGVKDNVLLYPHEVTFENGNQIISVIKTPGIAAFIHDGDGRLDRDFLLFWPLLRTNGLIIIDDYVNKANFKPISRQHPQGGIKSLMTYRLLNQIMEWGLFKPTCQIGRTIFGHKPPDADFSRFDLEVCRRIIERIQRERMESFPAGE